MNLKKSTFIYFLTTNISLLILSSVTFAQTSQQIKSAEINPFDITIIKGTYDYMAHRILIALTDKELKIFDQTGMAEMKDSLLFSKLLSPSDTLFQISKLNFDQLKYGYLNPCVANGSQFYVSITKNGKWKRVYLGNCYQQDVGSFISLVNMLVPEKYKVWYDRKILEAESCAGYERGEAIQLFDSTSRSFLRLDSTHTTVSAIDKNGRILWKTELDNDLWNDVLPFRGKNDSANTKKNRIKGNSRPEVTYFRLSKENDTSWCRAPKCPIAIWIGYERMTFVALDVKNGKLLWSGRD
jgi:hypothetical protein